jgi:hypothetical protein
MAEVKCPGCGKTVWDIATIDQRLNKCWECGLRFDNPDRGDEVMKEPGEVWDELEYDDRAKIVDKFSGEWDDGSHVDDAFWEDLSEHDKNIIANYFEREELL